MGLGHTTTMIGFLEDSLPYSFILKMKDDRVRIVEIFREINARFGNKMTPQNKKDALWGTSLLRGPGPSLHTGNEDDRWEIQFHARDLNTLMVIRLLT